jgi:hypothetical protein
VATLYLSGFKLTSLDDTASFFPKGSTSHLRRSSSRRRHPILRNFKGMHTWSAYDTVDPHFTVCYLALLNWLVVLQDSSMSITPSKYLPEFLLKFWLSTYGQSPVASFRILIFDSQWSTPPIATSTCSSVRCIRQRVERNLPSPKEVDIGFP